MVFSNIGLNRGTLPLTSPCRGTKRKTSCYSFFVSTRGLRLPHFRPILLKTCLIILIFYSFFFISSDITRFLEKFHYPFYSFYAKLDMKLYRVFLYIDSMWTALGDTEIRNCERDFSPSTVPFVLSFFLFIGPYKRILPEHSPNPFLPSTASK